MRNIVAIGVLLLAACSPCKKLAEKICDCHGSQSERNNCKNRLSLLSQHKAFGLAEDTQRCEDILKSPDCTCQAIISNQYEKCGITR
jgi:hypothetical protein